MNVQLYTLGRLSLQRDGAEVSGEAAQPRRLALLVLLAVAGTAGMPRDKVLGLLWAEHPSPRAILNEAVSVLRLALGKSSILSVGDVLRLNPSEVWSDVGAFQELTARSPGEAADLYRGVFLDGFYVRGAGKFEQWAAREQDRLQREYGSVLEQLAKEAAATGDRLKAAEWWRRLALHHDSSVQVAMRYAEALVRAGEPVLAVRYAVEFDERLRNELGRKPEMSVLQHVRSLTPALVDGVGSPAPPSPDSTAASTSPPRAAAAGGDRLDGLPPELEVVDVIGEGSVARVYLVREPALRRQVAVKVLLPALAADATARARFEREAVAAAGIQHPNVAPVYRTGRLADGVPYLVMPYFQGGSLEARLRGAGPFELGEVRRYIGQVASGLAAAHRMSIVHRDVRPANILYDRDTHRVVLIDFGIAAVLDDCGDAAVSRLTRPGEPLGIPVYASPEQLRANPSITDRADVYSLGVVAFEMLVGRPPFRAVTAVGMMRAHALETPPSVDELRPEVEPGLARLIACCLRKPPEERPSAADVAEAMAG